MLSSDFGTGQVLLAFIEITFFVIWIYLLFIVILDLFRSHDLSGWAKAAWALGLIIFPYLAVLVYIIARGHKMQQHVQAEAAAQDLAARKFIQETVDTSATNTAAELAKLSDLKDRGVIDQADFDRLKAKLIADAPETPSTPGA
jgi:hypothetical protein